MCVCVCVQRRRRRRVCVCRGACVLAAAHVSQTPLVSLSRATRTPLHRPQTTIDHYTPKNKKPAFRRLLEAAANTTAAALDTANAQLEAANAALAVAELDVSGALFVCVFECGGGRRVVLCA